jgi:hypothetical protein
MRVYVSVAVASVCAVLGLLLCGDSTPAKDGGDWGAVKGRIVYDGDSAPESKEIAVNKDQDHCLSKGKLYSEELVVNKENKGVRYTFVWLAPGKGEPPLQIHPNLQKPKQINVEIDQPCCQFVPHALGMRDGQILVAKNSAPIAHNVHWTGHPIKNPGGNQIVPAGQQIAINNLQADRFPVKVNCDIHGWMTAWVRVFDHPYFAVTDENGKFEIKQAPAGKCRLIIWHESGWGPGMKDGQPVAIEAGKTGDLGEIKFKPPQ